MANKSNKDASKFTPSQVELMLMTALLDKELYGLQIERAVREGSDGRFNVTIGSLYPILSNLEKEGMIKSRWGEKQPEERGRARRRFYKLTGLGSQALDRYQQDLTGIRNWQPV